MVRILALCLKDIKNPEAGGGTRIFHRLLSRLASEKHEVTLISSKFALALPTEALDGVKIVRPIVAPALFLIAPLLYFRRHRRKVDLIIECIYGIPWFTPVYALERKVAVLYHLLDKSLFAEDLYAKAGLLSILLAPVGIILQRCLSVFYRRMPFITLSDSTRFELIRMGLPHNNIIAIQEGVDLKEYTPSLDKDSIPHVIYVGRLRKYKGVHHLIRSMALVVKDLPSAELSIVGTGDFMNNLVSLTRRLGLEKNVAFFGRATQERKIELLRKAHLFVHPSKKEGWGTTIIEANACGAVAIGFNSPGVREAIVDGCTGFLVPYGDISALARCIIELFTDEELYSNMREQAIQWAKRFDSDIAMNELSDIIKGII